MSIGRDEVMHVAKLAELAVSEGELDGLVSQLNRIVEFVAQLDRVALEPDVPAFVAGPAAVALRDDVVGSVPLARPPQAFAPEMADGLFLVPRRGAAAMAAEAGPGAVEDDAPEMES
jgi:aspartyl-tRNA(Asn)/glutamyl-tRNA(Gln) amidotransferase subunit C